MDAGAADDSWSALTLCRDACQYTTRSPETLTLTDEQPVVLLRDGDLEDGSKRTVMRDGSRVELQ